MSPALIAREPPLRAQRRTRGDTQRDTLWQLITGDFVIHGDDSLPHTTPSLSSDLAHRIVRRGMTGAVLGPLADVLELGPTQLAPLIGVDRTTARRYAREDQALPASSAETVIRLAELEKLAHDVFETDQAAHGWLKAAHPSLEGDSPLEAASTSFGGQRVREILVAIKYGAVA